MRLPFGLALAAFACAMALPAHVVAASDSSTMPTCAAGDPVVWVNTSSKVFHVQGDSYYGKTKHGKYMCQTAAVAAGDRAAKASPVKKGATAAATASPSAGKHHHKSKASPSPAPAAT